MPGWDSLSRARHRSSRRSISGGMRAVMSTNSALSGVRGMRIRIRPTTIDSNRNNMRMYTLAYVFKGGKTDGRTGSRPESHQGPSRERAENASECPRPPADRSNRANAGEKCRNFDPEVDRTATAADGRRSRGRAPDDPEGDLRADPARASTRGRSSPTPSLGSSDRPARVAAREGRAVVGGTTMSVSVRKYEDGKTKGYEVDIVARLPDGRTKRS